MIAITTSGQSLNSNVDPRFGRSQHFLVLDKQGNVDEVISNPGVGAERGAGVQAAQTVADAGVEVLITNNIGASAFSALQTAGVEIYLAKGMTAEEAFEKWSNDDLNKAEAPTGPAGSQGAGGRGVGGREPNENRGPEGKGQGPPVDAN